MQQLPYDEAAEMYASAGQKRSYKGVVSGI